VSQSDRASPAIWDHTLPLTAGERAPLQAQPDRPVLDLPTSEGWKAELTLMPVALPDSHSSK